MTRRRSGVAVLALAAALVSAPAARAAAGEGTGQSLRVALLLGNNVGSGRRPALRFAEDDARRVGDVLQELGGFRPEHVHTLLGRSLREVAARFEALQTTLAAHRARNARVVLLVYFSGHSDGQALELGRDRWQFDDFRQALAGLDADVRLTIIDTCQSGGLLAEKGGRPGPSYDIRFRDDLATKGEATLTSSTSDELALESREIGASFFSHHLISGLRGAADSSGDGRVTLGEAYRYAFVNTLVATVNTLHGPQHPGYDYRMSGRGELVLTDVVARGATLTLPGAFDRILVADEPRAVLVELSSTAAHRIAVPAGRYRVHGRRAGRTYEAIVSLREGESRSMSVADFDSAGSPTARGKGGALATAPEPGTTETTAGVSLAVSAGLVRGAASALPWLGALEIAAASRGVRGFSLSVGLATGRTTGFRESATRLALGAFTGMAWGRLRARTGWRVVGGAIVQELDSPGERGGESSAFATPLGTGPWASVSLALGGRLSLAASAGLDATWLERDRARELAWWPHLGAGLCLDL